MIKVLDTDGTSAVENVEAILERLIARKQRRRLLHLRLQPLLQLMKRLGKEHGIPGQAAMEQIMACGLGPCYICVRTFEVDGKQGTAPRVHRRAGVRSAGVRGMVDLSVKIGSVTLKNPIMPASGTFSTEVAQVIDLNRLGALVSQDRVARIPHRQSAAARAPRSNAA